MILHYIFLTKFHITDCNRKISSIIARNLPFFAHHPVRRFTTDNRRIVNIPMSLNMFFNLIILIISCDLALHEQRRRVLRSQRTSMMKLFLKKADDMFERVLNTTLRCSGKILWREIMDHLKQMETFATTYLDERWR